MDIEEIDKQVVRSVLRGKSTLAISDALLTGISHSDLMEVLGTVLSQVGTQDFQTMAEKHDLHIPYNLKLALATMFADKEFFTERIQRLVLTELKYEYIIKHIKELAK
jgi:hypothetical protein